MAKKRAKPKRKPINWKPIKLAYRKGAMNNLQLSKKYKINECTLRKKIRVEGWTKDLAKKIKAKTNKKLAVQDEQIVESVSDVAVQLVIDHRGDLSTVRTAANKMINELCALSQPPEILNKLLHTISEGEDLSTIDARIMRDAIRRAYSLPGRASALRHLAQTLSQVIPLERQAYGLNDESENPEEAYTPMAERMKKYAKELEHIPGPPLLKLVSKKK